MVTATAAGAVAQPPAGSSPGQPGSPSYADSVDVREVEITVGLPELSDRRRAALDASAFQVTDDGRGAVVTRVEPVPPVVGGVGPWSLLIYVDHQLARPELVMRTLAALAERAPALVALGRVDVVVADPVPREVVSGATSAEVVATVLGELVRVAGERAAAPEIPLIDPPSELEVVRLQSARLLAALAERDPASPRALLLVAQANQATSGRGARPPVDLLAQFPDAGKALSAYGWAVVTLAVQPPPATPSEAGRPGSRDEFETFRAVAQGEDQVTFSVGAKPADYDLQRALENAFEPRYVLIRALARESGGGVAQSAAGVDRALADLGRRYRVVYRASGPSDGRLRPVEVRLVPDDLELAAPRWRRSGVPEALGRARAVELMRGGGAGRPTLVLNIDAIAQDGQPALRVGVAVAQPAGVRPLAGNAGYRVTVATEVAGGEPTVASSVVTAEAITGGRSHVAALVAAANAERAAVVVEDLETGAWGGQAFALAKMPRGLLPGQQ